MANAAAPDSESKHGRAGAALRRASEGDRRSALSGRYAGRQSRLTPFLVTSAIAKGRIERLDLDDARAVPGVLDILTHENTTELKTVKFGERRRLDLHPEAWPGNSSRRSDHRDRGRRYFRGGERSGLQGVKATYARQNAVRDFDSPGVTEDATKVSKQHKHLPQAGDADGRDCGAPRSTIDVEYGTPTQHHNPIELFTTTCVWTGDQLTVYEPSQFVYGLKNGVAQRLGIEPDKVRVVSPLCRRRVRLKGHDDAAHGNDRARREEAQSAGQARRHARSGFHHRDLSRRNPAPHPARRADATASSSAYSHEGWEISSRPDPYVVAGVEDSAQIYAFGAVDDQGQRRSCRPQHAGLHALAAGRALHLRARKRDGRDGAEARHGSGRVPPHQRHDDEPDRRQALFEPLADEMLRSGRRGVRLEASATRNPARCATATGWSAGDARPRSIRPISAPRPRACG